MSLALSACALWMDWKVPSTRDGAAPNTVDGIFLFISELHPDTQMYQARMALRSSCTVEIGAML